MENQFFFVSAEEPGSQYNIVALNIFRVNTIYNITIIDS